MVDGSSLEHEILVTGRRLIDGARRRERGFTDAAWWEERLLEFCTAHPRLKVELFRFIDVLPVLEPDDVTPHLIEYLGDVADELPPMLRWGVGASPARGVVAKIISRSARQNVRRMARRFIAGRSTAEVLGVVASLRSRQLAITLDVLGEAVVTEAEADAYRDCYLELLAALSAGDAGVEPTIDLDHDGRPLPRANVSLKLSALAAKFDPIDPRGAQRAVEERLITILDAAHEAGGFVYVDMENYELKDLTLAIFKDVLGRPSHANRGQVGIVLQAYLRDCERDIASLAQWARERGAPVWVRLVKGAYWDYETVLARQRDWPVPVFENKWETDAAFERCTALLLDHADVLRPAIASHNTRSIAHALALARQRGLPDRFLEFQTLYGMADPLKEALVELGQRVRVYTPYGELLPGMAYLVRRLLENTSNESFLRHQVVGDQSAEELLAAPTRPVRAKAADPAPRTRGVRPFQNEPLCDFSSAGARAELRAALAGQARASGRVCPVVIDGEEIRTEQGLAVRCPADVTRVLGRSSLASPAHVDRAVQSALAGGHDWGRRSADDRAAMLERAAQLLGASRAELAASIVLEAGKPWRDADADVAEAMDFCRYYAAEMRRLGAPRSASLPGETNQTLLAPRGVTAVISPWNFPLAILTGMATAALAAGNPVILKPAEQTPLIAYHLYRILRQAGIPAQVLHLLPGVGEVVGAALVAHPDVATIAFTGSRAVGRFIACRAAETSTGRFGLKRVIAEMGGKNAIIVDNDADLDEAVPGVLQSAFGYAGQKCSACSRVLVVGRVYERFVSRLSEAAAALVVGPPDDPATDIGPVIDEDAVRRVEEYSALARREGRVRFETPLASRHATGHFVPALVVTDLPSESRILSEEIFGPVLAVARAETFEQALGQANATDYALTAGLYSRSPRHIEHAAHALAAGNLYINRKITGAFVGRQPFGGFRHSGAGHKAGGPHYLPQFAVERTLTENTLRCGFAPNSE